MKLVVISDSLSNKTGYNYLTLALLELLYINMNIDIFYISINSKDSKIFFYNKGYSLNISYFKKFAYFPILSKEKIPTLLNLFKLINPDLVLTLGDIWFLIPIFELKNIIPFKWLHYFITETDNLYHINTYFNVQIDLKKIIQEIDYIIPHARMSLKVLKNWNIKSENIIHPHIIKLAPRIGLNEEEWKTFSKLVEKENNFYNTRILVIAKNFTRKNLETIIHAFSLLEKVYKESKNFYSRLNEESIKNIRFIFNVYPHFSNQGWDIKYLVQKYNINEKSSCIKENINDNELFILLRASDILLNLSSAEGIGLPIIDANQLELKVIGPDYGLPKYYLKDSCKVKPYDYFYPVGLNQKWAYFRPIDLTHKILETLSDLYFDYDDEILTGRIQKSSNVRNMIKTNAKKKWIKLFTKICKQNFINLGIDT